MKFPTTTVDPYDLYDNDFIYSDPFGQGYINNRDYFVQVFFGSDPYDFVDITWAARQIYDVAVFVCFFANLPHLFFLTRKELRRNLVYIIMIGICLCDLLHALAKMSSIFMTWHIIYPQEKCPATYPYYHVWIDVMAITLQIMCRRCSGLLALFMAGFRAFSVMFPMSNAVNFLMKAESGFLIVLMIAMSCGGWSSWYYNATKIVKVLDCTYIQTTSYVPYRQEITSDEENRFRLYDGYLSAVVVLLYVIVTGALVIALFLANERRKNLKNQKAPNTSSLVIAMAISLFVSELSYAVLFVAGFFLLRGFDDRPAIIQLESVALTLSIIHSITHCFICFFMSSQYRDTVKRFIWTPKAKDVKVAVVEASSAHPSTKNTSKTSNTSKKTF
ncbi:hypothetical protein L5515_006780 [Caenorhabditis briggsae]|uniref:G-protein coupled receptors family 1 profile domain-containing protein n=1 Tax=Caenorhabditis briggsae TaxID=6238 RepID=A0AAE9F2T4_CAEBR|nr:hypothetical protein L5515_006780 [Caenorhabditis briggsae]